jgi:hypothetical protein
MTPVTNFLFCLSDLNQRERRVAMCGGYGYNDDGRGVGATTLYLHRLMTRSACPPGLAGSRL